MRNIYEIRENPRNVESWCAAFSFPFKSPVWSIGVLYLFSPGYKPIRAARCWDHKYYNEAEADYIHATIKLKIIFNNDLLMPVFGEKVFYNTLLKGHNVEPEFPRRLCKQPNASVFLISTRWRQKIDETRKYVIMKYTPHLFFQFLYSFCVTRFCRQRYAIISYLWTWKMCGSDINQKVLSWKIPRLSLLLIKMYKSILIKSSYFN